MKKHGKPKETPALARRRSEFERAQKRIATGGPHDWHFNARGVRVNGVGKPPRPERRAKATTAVVASQFNYAPPPVDHAAEAAFVEDFTARLKAVRSESNDLGQTLTFLMDRCIRECRNAVEQHLLQLRAK